MNGYLNNQFNQNVNNLRKQYKNEYEFIEEIGQLLYDVAEKNCEKGTSQRNIYIVAAIVHIYKFYQSAILLLERGIIEPAYSIMRSMIELSLKIIEVINNEEFLVQITLKEQFEFRKQLMYLKENELYNMIDKDILDKRIDEINKTIEGKKNPDLETKLYKIADKNNLKEPYAVYKYNCDYVHLSITAIMRKVKFENNEIFIDSRPEFDELKDDINLISSIPLLLLPYIVEYVNNEEIKDRYAKLEESVKEYMKNK